MSDDSLSQIKLEIFNSHRRQYFSISFGIISYITQNPISTGGLSKLQKSCKYFFAKNKIVIVTNDIKYVDKKLFYIFYNSKTGYFYERKFCFKEDLKYWFTERFEADHSMEILKNIYRFNLKALVLYKQSLTLEEINFLLNGGKIRVIWFRNVSIKNDHGSLFTCDRILEKVPKCTKFNYDCEDEIFTNKIFENMAYLKLTSKFESFDLTIHKLATEVDVSLLCDFIRNNSSRRYSEFHIYFKMANAGNYQSTLLAATKKIPKSWRSIRINIS